MLKELRRSHKLRTHQVPVRLTEYQNCALSLYGYYLWQEIKHRFLCKEVYLRDLQSGGGGGDGRRNVRPQTLILIGMHKCSLKKHAC